VEKIGRGKAHDDLVDSVRHRESSLQGRSRGESRESGMNQGKAIESSYYLEGNTIENTRRAESTCGASYGAADGSDRVYVL
jgi:hypothetical protein